MTASRPGRSGKNGQPEGSLGHVVALGAYILDVLGRPVETIPPGQGSVRLEEIKATAAGTAAGPAVDLAKLGARVTAVGAIGDDLIADIITGVLASYGIDTRGLVRKANQQTSATMLPIRPNGERPALHVPGATSYLTIGDIDPAWLDGCDVLLIGAPDRLSPQLIEGLTGLAGTAGASGALVLIDVLGPGRPEDFERLRKLIGTADWFCPNEDQLRRLTGRDDLIEAITEVLALGTHGVAVTLGENGALVSAGPTAHPDPVHIPAHDITVVDTTGCGDAFDAGMITGLLLRRRSTPPGSAPPAE